MNYSVFIAPSRNPANNDLNSRVYGKTLSEWLGIYWRWFYSTDADPAQSMVGRVKLLPLPAGEAVVGAGTPEDPQLLRGQLKVTLRAGTPFVLPLAVWTAERYNNNSPDEEGVPDADFLAGVSPHAFIDGRLVVSTATRRSLYVPLTAFDPIVTYPKASSYNSIAAIAYQGYGIVIRPLSVGTHVVHLYERYVIRRPAAFGLIYDNTWIITVLPH